VATSSSPSWTSTGRLSAGRGATQHTWTRGCDGLHGPGPCPDRPAPVTVDTWGLTKAQEEKRDAQQIFAEGKACGDCGGIHQRACPRIRRQAWIGQGSGAGKPHRGRILADLGRHGRDLARGRVSTMRMRMDDDGPAEPFRPADLPDLDRLAGKRGRLLRLAPGARRTRAKSRRIHDRVPAGVDSGAPDVVGRAAAAGVAARRRAGPGRRVPSFDVIGMSPPVDAVRPGPRQRHQGRGLVQPDR